MKAIENLMTKRGKFDYILLETTGLADPGLLLIPFCLFVCGNVQNHYLHCPQFSCLMTAVGCSVVNKDSGTAALIVSHVLQNSLSGMYSSSFLTFILFMLCCSLLAFYVY